MNWKAVMPNKNSTGRVKGKNGSGAVPVKAMNAYRRSRITAALTLNLGTRRKCVLNSRLLGGKKILKRKGGSAPD